MTIEIEEKQTNVLVIGAGSLLDQGVANLIRHEPGFHVATTTNDNSCNSLENADLVRPDVILLCEIEPINQARVCEVLKQIPIDEAVRLIIIRRENNILEVYDKQIIELDHNADTDLITLIKDH
jgi:DNA-binding NarL/FixJ family response regulator